ncbi:D-inositol-3-phosphate glycosyltransferase [subsurface metagenome]
MNVLYYDFLNLEDHGNEATHIYEVLSNLSKLGHNVVLLNRGRLTNAKEIQLPQQPSRWRGIRGSLRSVPVFRFVEGEITVAWRLVREIQTFIVVLVAMMRRKVSPDVVYMRHDLFNGGYSLARLFRVPVVKEVNGILVDEMRAKNEGSSALLWAISHIERFSLPRGSKIIAVTSKLKEVLHDNYNVPEDKIVVIQNGANTDLFKPMDEAEARRKLNLNQGNDYICFVGSLVKWQGIEYLIKSMPLILERCPDIRLLIVGDGIMKNELIELAKQIGLSDKIIFTGKVPYHKVPLYINASDVCVLPKTPLKSGYSPLILYEYMACAKPVVATRTSGLEILEEYNAGLLFHPMDTQELADAVTTLLKNGELKRRLGKNGRKYVVENQSWASVAQRIADVSEGLIGRKGIGKQ